VPIVLDWGRRYLWDLRRIVCARELLTACSLDFAIASRFWRFEGGGIWVAIGASENQES